MFEFKRPTVAGATITPEQAAMLEYTRIREVLREDAPDAHNAYLVVGQQSFCITPLSCDTEEHASRLCLELAKALTRIEVEVIEKQDSQAAEQQEP